MIEACKYKAAAASINWMVSLIKHKKGADRLATRGILESMFHEMVAQNCTSCPQYSCCHELDSATRVLSASPSKAREAAPLVSRPSGIPLSRRENRRLRVIRTQAL